MNYVLVVIATILIAVEISISKWYQAVEGPTAEKGLQFNALVGLFMAILFWAYAGFKIQFSLYSMIFASCIALFTMSYTLIGFKMLNAGAMSYYSLFLMCGGMLLPYVFGVIFLNEELNWMRIVGVIVITLAIILSNKMGGIGRWMLLLAVCVFVINGFVSVFSKCHQINTTYPMVDIPIFVMYSGIMKCLLSGIALLCFRMRLHRKIQVCSRKGVALAALFAVASGVGFVFQLIGAAEIPATVLYPMITGGSIVFSTVFGWLFFKEKVSRVTIISTSLCMVGTLLFL